MGGFFMNAIEIGHQPPLVKLSPVVYSEKAVSGQPDCLFKLSDGNWWIDPKRIIEGSQGPFDLVADYGRSLEGLREPTEVDYWPEGVAFHSRKNENVCRSFNNLSSLVGTGLDPASPQFGVLYAANFIRGFIEPFQKAVADWKGKDWTLLSPLRGGRVVQEIAKALGYDPNIPKIRASRVMVKTGEEPTDKSISYLVGVRQLEPVEKIDDLAMFADDCCAAAGSGDTVLRWAKSLNGGLKEIRFAVGVGVKRSIDILNKTWGDGASPMGERCHAGAEANRMGENYYLELTPEHQEQENLPSCCKQRVGDMGKAMDFSEPERGKMLLQIVQAVAQWEISHQGGISPEQVFERTAKVIKNPNELELQANKLLEVC